MKRNIGYALIGLLLIGCAKDGESDLPDPLAEGSDWDIVIPSSKDQPGIGNTDGLPGGTPWELPEGIAVVARPDKPFDPNPGLLYGNLNTFYADVNFVNDRNVTITVEIPGGLICLFKHEGRTQNGLLTSSVRVQVPPTYPDGKTPSDTTTVYLGLGCLNYSMAFPWEENQQWDTQDYPIGKDMYEPGVVTTDPNIVKLLDLLKGYPKLRLTQHYNPQEMFDEDYKVPEWRVIYTLIQAALWEITDGPGLTRKDYRELVEALEPYK